VLDHQDGSVRRNAADQLRDALDILAAHAGHGLVEQHHLGIERQRRRNLQRALAPVGELHRRDAGELGEADRLDEPERLGVEVAQHPFRAPEVEGVAPLALQRDPDVLQDRQMREYGGDLEGAHEAEAGDLGRSHRRDVAAVVLDPPPGRGQELSQEIEAGGLAGPVRADQGVNRPTPHSEGHPVDGGETLELLGQVRGRENDVAGHATPVTVLFLRRFEPAAPLSGMQHGGGSGVNRGAPAGGASPAAATQAFEPARSGPAVHGFEDQAGGSLLALARSYAGERQQEHGRALGILDGDAAPAFDRAPGTRRSKRPPRSCRSSQRTPSQHGRRSKVEAASTTVGVGTRDRPRRQKS
jgi:hypothetical protein